MSSLTSAIGDVVNLSETMVTAIMASSVLLVVMAVPFARIGLSIFRSMFKTAKRA